MCARMEGSVIQIGIRFHDTKEVPLTERIQIVKQQGFSCVHLALAKAIRENSVRNPALTPGYAMYLRKLFADAGIDIAVLGCYMNLATPNKDKLEETIAMYKAQIRFSGMLGAGVVGTETGAPNETYVYEEACHSQKALDYFIKNLAKVVEYAEQMGVIVAIEPVYRHIVYNAKRAREVLDTIQSPNLQIIFDPVNLLDACNYRDQVEIIKEAIDVLGEDVAVIHIKDFQMTAKGLISVAAGTGEMKYDDLMTFIKKDKPYIHATLEDTIAENAVAAREFIQELYDNAKLPTPTKGDYGRV